MLSLNADIQCIDNEGQQQNSPTTLEHMPSAQKKTHANTHADGDPQLEAVKHGQRTRGILINKQH